MIIAYQAIAAGVVEQTAAALTIPSATQRAQLQASAQNIRYRLDDGPTDAVTGMTLIVGNDPVWVEREDLDRIRFISANVAAPAQLDIQYWTTRNI